MPADTSVKFIHSDMTGAPQNPANTPGTIIAILDAALVDGFGTATIDSLVIANNVATVTINAGHPFEVGSVALIAGATPVELNGEHRILTTTTTTYTFETTGISDQTATGSITHKVAPLGWEKPFSSTNLAAYRSADLLSTRCFLRIDDTHNQFARARGYIQLADIATGTDPFPALTTADSVICWLRNFGTGSRQWSLVGDKKRFYLHIQYSDATNNLATWFFGDLIPFREGDPYACAINVQGGATSAAETSVSGSLPFEGASTGLWVARSVTGVGSAISATRASNTIAGRSNVSGVSGFAYPNTSDNSIALSEFFLTDSSPYNLRGRFPGFYFVAHNVTGVFTNRQRVEGVIGHPGKTFRAMVSSSTWLVDATGPWE